MNNEILKLAKECGWSGIYSEWSGPDMTEKTYLTVPVTKEQIEAFYRAAFNAGLEAAASGCENSIIGFCLDGDWAEGYLQGVKDIAEGIRTLEMKS